MSDIATKLTAIAENQQKVYDAGFAFAEKIINRTIRKINSPSVTTIGTAAFNGCTMLSEVNFPAVTSIGASAFNGCTMLSEIDFSSLEVINNAAFYSCISMLALILRRETGVCTLSSTNAFTGSRIGNGGYIYVPAALLSSYQEATNWSKYAGKFRALEDYTVDGTITGALDSGKI